MDLVFLYGPPAVGKLTIAKEVERLTGYKNFHNHLTLDMLQPLFEWGSPPFIELANKIREDVIAIATREGIPGLIFTFVYGETDRAWVEQVAGLIESSGGKICFVQLTAPKDVLLQRVNNADRRQYRKINSPEKLAQVMADHDLTTAIDHQNHISIDTATINPAETAQQVVQHFGLPMIY